VLPEAGEDYKESEMKALETMKAAKFDVIDNKVVIDLITIGYRSIPIVYQPVQYCKT
jgi:hypothetical protein